MDRAVVTDLAPLAAEQQQVRASKAAALEETKAFLAKHGGAAGASKGDASELASLKRSLDAMQKELKAIKAGDAGARTGLSGKRVRVDDAPPPNPRPPTPPLGSKGGAKGDKAATTGDPPFPCTTGGRKFNKDNPLVRWGGVAKALQEDIKKCPSLADADKRWPCMKRFLLGTAPCAQGCRSCETDEGVGHPDVRKRARVALDKMLAGGAIASELAADLKKHSAARA